MHYELQKISPQKFKVVNTETGVIHSHFTSKKKAQAQIRLLNMLHGKGFFNDMVNSVKNVGNQAIQGTRDLGNKVMDLAQKVVNPSTAYPPELTQLKKDIGTENVTAIEIRRTPVPKAITTAMDVVSLGSFKKKLSRTSYDSLFHLFLVAKTDKGSQFLLEKNSRINVERNIPTLPNTSTMPVQNIPVNLSVNALIDNTQNAMGNKFLPYNPVDNNCQDFILAVLKTNSLSNPELEKFVKQDTSSLFSDDPNLAKISTGLTNLGGSMDVLMHGGKIPTKNKQYSNLLSLINIHMFHHHRLPQAENQVRSALGIPVHVHLHPGMEGSGIDWGNIGRSIADTFHIPTDTAGAKKLAKTALTYGLPALGGATVGAVGTALSGGNPIAGILAGSAGTMAGRVGAEQANKQIGDGLKRGRGRPRKGMSGSGWLNSVLDRPFTARQAIQLAKNVPNLANEGIADVRGAGLKEDLIGLAMNGAVGKRVPKVAGVHTGAISGQVIGQGMGKGSEAMREKMARLRSLRKKK